VISGGSPADRFVMGLLRACAEVVIVAGGTFWATPNHRWTADHIFPSLADVFERLRQDLQRAAQPTLVVVSARGNIDTRHPAREGPSLVLTTREGEARLRGRVPNSCKLRALPEGQPSVASVIDAVREGFSIVLTEGGPTEGGRKALVEGADVLGREGAEARLLSLRMHRSYLFLRYRLGKTGSESAPGPQGTGHPLPGAESKTRVYQIS
jgi:hypothetical protein